MMNTFIKLFIPNEITPYKNDLEYAKKKIIKNKFSLSTSDL